MACGETASALDTVPAQAIVDLPCELQDRLKWANDSSHEISTIARVADTIGVMQNSNIVEHGSTGAVLAPPRHPGTELLLKSVPELRPDRPDMLELLVHGGATGDAPNAR